MFFKELFYGGVCDAWRDSCQYWMPGKNCPHCQSYLSSMLWDFHMQRGSATANWSMTGQLGLDGISLLPPKLYCSDKCCQYIDRMSKSWKTAFSYTAQSCHTQSLYSTFNSTASSCLLILLQISVTEAENTRFSRLDASTDRKRKVNWALRRDD